MTLEWQHVGTPMRAVKLRMSNSCNQSDVKSEFIRISLSVLYALRLINLSNVHDEYSFELNNLATCLSLKLQNALPDKEFWRLRHRMHTKLLIMRKRLILSTSRDTNPNIGKAHLLTCESKPHAVKLAHCLLLEWQVICLSIA